MKHRALSMLLALVMAVSLLPVAALAGNGEDETGLSFKMRYQGDSFSDSYNFSPGTYQGVELGLFDEAQDRGRLLTDEDTVTCDGVVTEVSYTPVEQENQKGETFTAILWTITVAETENGTKEGHIIYENQKITINLRENHGVQVTEENVVGLTADEQKVTSFEQDGKTYYLGVGDANGDSFDLINFGGCELDGESGSCNFTFSAQLLTKNDNDEYVPVDEATRAKYTAFVRVWPTKNCVGQYYPLEEAVGEGSLHCRFTAASLGTWIIEATAIPNGEQTGYTHCAQLTVSLRRTQADGNLGMSYDGSDFVRSYQLLAGTYGDIEFKVGNESLNYSAIHEDTPANQKLTCGGLVSDFDYNGNRRWSITLDEPSGEETTGWIQYGTNDSNRVIITVLPSRGKEVGENDRIVQGSDEFDWASWGTVMPFEWNGQTYYLGTAAWSTKKPYALGGRGVEEDEDYYAASVFSLMSGEVGSASATYQLREDIRAAMEKEGYRFELTLVPTDIGCAYYPAIRTVNMKIEQQGDGTTATFTSEWQGQKFSKDSVGVWVYDARLYKDGEQVQRNLSNCEYSYDINRTVELTEKDVTQINEKIEQQISEVNAQIKAEIGESFGKNDNGLYNTVVTLVLPAGELEGQIVIPQTNAIVTVYGNDYGRGRIATTLKGGIRFDNNNTNHVGYIHFIGKGKNVEWVDEENEIPNEAVYGEGQGTPEVCLFEDYNIAIHSTDRPSWGSQDSIYINNNVAICQDGENGGQTIMRNNWFVGNNTAVVMKRSVSVDYLMSFKNRFINNEIDLSNESENVLWLSQNFFYHDFDGENSWQPVLWGKDENGVLEFNYDNGLIRDRSENAPAFMDPNYNASKSEAKYLDFLPLFSTEGDSPKPMAYPLARTQDCSSFFYPNWGRDGENYPSYVLWGETISENDLDHLRCSSFDKQNNVVTGTIDFGASAAEAEN